MHLERTLKIRKDGRVTEEILRIGDIREEDGRWCCYWSIGRIHSVPSKAVGNDSLSALVRVLWAISDFIRKSERDGWFIHWQTEGDRGGLPEWGSFV